MIMIDSCGTVHWHTRYLELDVDTRNDAARTLYREDLILVCVENPEPGRQPATPVHKNNSIWNIENSAYTEPAYKELPIIRKWFYFTNLYQGTSSLYVYKELHI